MTTSNQGRHDDPLRYRWTMNPTGSRDGDFTIFDNRMVRPVVHSGRKQMDEFETLSRDKVSAVNTLEMPIDRIRGRISKVTYFGTSSGLGGSAKSVSRMVADFHKAIQRGIDKKSQDGSVYFQIDLATSRDCNKSHLLL